MDLAIKKLKILLIFSAPNNDGLLDCLVSHNLYTVIFS